MSLFISSVFTYDEDAGNYIQAVETADAQALEPATRKAINNFVIGCKQDGIWPAIKASCILAGARTRLGALTPLAGTAPDSFNFVDANYNRKTGLIGSTSGVTAKYIDTNYSEISSAQDNQHYSLYVSTVPTITNTRFYLSRGDALSGSACILSAGNVFSFRSQSSAVASFTPSIANNVTATTGFIGARRSSSSTVDARVAGVSYSGASTSQAPAAGNFMVYSNSPNTSFLNPRLAFYSIGESLDLALLDARVTDLINAFAVTIP